MYFMSVVGRIDINNENWATGAKLSNNTIYSIDPICYELCKCKKKYDANENSTG